MFGKHYPVLIIRSGSRRGKKLRLRRDRVALGSDSKCQVVLKDPGVDAHHASLHRRGADQWEIENHSPTSTQVDKLPVQKKLLRHGALIRLGQGTLLEFTLPDSAEARAASTPATPDKRRGLSHGALVGIGLYWIVLMVGGFYFLGGDSTNTPLPVLTMPTVRGALDDTRAFLAELRAPEAGRALRLRIDPHSEEAAEFYELAYREGAGVDNRVRSSLRINAILEELEALFQAAWHLEAQQRWRDAAAVYRRITRLVPDIRCPTTRLATDRLRRLREILADDA